jgi:thiol-disulfide isomerase/thioredoxin
MKKNVILLLIAFCAALVSVCFSDEPPNLVGCTMPQLTVTNWLSANQLDPRDLEGRIYVVEFWATWCPTCMVRMPHLNELAQKYRSDGVIFLTFSENHCLDKPQAYIEKKKYDFFAAMDTGASSKLGVTWIPMAYIVGCDGKILWQGEPNDAFEAALEKAVKAAPPAFLKGVDLGCYENLRFKLSGCCGFCEAYKTLRADAENKESENAAVAAQIIKTIDARITARINKIRAIQKVDPDAAAKLYRRLVARFKGAEPTAQAKAEYEKLKQNRKKEKES